jgi:hypothetical protein
MQMIDVMKKLREIADNNPEAGRAIDSLQRMNGPVSEGVQVTTTGSDAVLAQILKLAGMINAEEVIDFNAGPQDNMALAAAPGVPMDVGHHMGIPHPVSKPTIAAPGAGLPMTPPGDIPGAMPSPGGMPDEETVVAAEASDDRPYSNSPHEYEKGISAAVPNGNDLAKSKLTAPKVAGGDNPVHVAVTFD